jgi:hypothetical protein
MMGFFIGLFFLIKIIVIFYVFFRMYFFLDSFIRDYEYRAIKSLLLFIMDDMPWAVTIAPCTAESINNTTRLQVLVPLSIATMYKYL